MTKRKAISKKIRFEIFKRDGFACQYCGATPPSVVLHVDHIHPVADGGTNDMHNLITACQPCNIGKSANLLTSIPKSLKESAEEVAERELQIKGYNQVLAAKAARIESEAWEVAERLERTEWLHEYSSQRLMSIKRFLERLPFQVVCDAAEIANARWLESNDRHFRYFCGVCWTRIREQ